MRPDALRSAIAADRAGGRTPLIVVANAGTTATGAIDPFGDLAEICREHGVWLHVDGAYGAFACLSERGREALAGMELADSITLDPHKWLYQPIELGALLVRDGAPAAPRLRDHAGLPRRRRGGRPGGELLRPRPAAHAHLPRAQAVDVDPLLRPRCVPRCDRRVPGPAHHAQQQITASPELELMTPASLGSSRSAAVRAASTTRRCSSG